MPQLSEIFSDLLMGAVEAVATAEARQLKAHVEAVQALGGEEPGTDTLIRLLDEGYVPDYFAGVDLDLSAQLSIATTRERRGSGTGGVTFGPVKIEGTLANSFTQATQTNLTVAATLRRQSKNAGIEHLLTSLRALTPAPPPGG